MSWRKAVRLNNNWLPLQNRRREWRQSSWIRLAFLKHHLFLLLNYPFPWKSIKKTITSHFTEKFLTTRFAVSYPCFLNSLLSFIYYFPNYIAPAKHCAIGTNSCFWWWAVFPSEHVSSRLWLFRCKFLAALWFLLIYQTIPAHIPWCHYLVQVEFPPPNSSTNHTKWCLMDQAVIGNYY